MSKRSNQKRKKKKKVIVDQNEEKLNVELNGFALKNQRFAWTEPWEPGKSLIDRETYKLRGTDDKNFSSM